MTTEKIFHTPSPATELEVISLFVGDSVRHCINGQAFGPYREIVRISFRGVSLSGKAYVGFDCRFGETSTISGSIAEGETSYDISLAL